MSTDELRLEIMATMNGAVASGLDPLHEARKAYPDVPQGLLSECFGTLAPRGTSNTATAAAEDELDRVALCILQSLLVAGTIPRQYGAQNGYDYVASAYAMATEVMRFRSGERSR